MAPHWGQRCSQSENSFLLCYKWHEEGRKAKPLAKRLYLPLQTLNSSIMLTITQQVTMLKTMTLLKSDPSSAPGLSIISSVLLWKIKEGRGFWKQSRRENQMVGAEGEAWDTLAKGNLAPCFRDLLPGTGWVWLGKGQSYDCTHEWTIKTPWDHYNHPSPSLPARSLRWWPWGAAAERGMHVTKKTILRAGEIWL